PFVGAVELDQHADAATVHIAGELLGGFKALEAANGNVFADFADQGRARAFDRAFGKRQFGQRGDVGGILVGDELRDVGDELDEVVVLGDEVGFAVDFNHGALLGVAGYVQADQAFGGDAAGGLAGLA